MKKVEFYTPLLVYLKQQEIENISEMLKDWKKEFLVGIVLKYWRRLENERTVGLLKKAMLLIEYTWPSIILTIVSFYSGVSALCLIAPLGFIQFCYFLWFLSKMYIGICVIAAHNLDKELK